jgi:catechol 2,3-dioxygenase-like lactoylglutathione lyase family enzyme
MQISMNRIILYVQDVAALKEFYTSHFGFPVTEEIEGEWVVLLAGQTELALHLAGLPYRTGQTRTGESNAKLVFTVDSPLPELRSKLEHAGVSVGKIKRYEGFTFSLCDGRDPEGNVFQLSKPD